MVVRRRLGAAAALVLALGAVAGCGGGDDADDGAGAPTASATASASATQPSTESSPEASPPVSPASGPVLRMDVAEVNVPAGWKKLDPLVSMVDTAGPRDGTSTITLSARTSFGNTLDELARITREQIGPKVTRRMPDVEIAGVPAYHVRETSKNRDSPWWLDQYGAIYDDQVVVVIMSLEKSLPEAEREEIRESVLATFRWT